MQIIVLAQRFEAGTWREWEHICVEDEVEAVVDSARAYAEEQARVSEPLDRDFLRGVSYVFAVAYGERNQPKQGDTRVYAVVVDGVLIGDYRQIEQHFRHKLWVG